MRSFTRVIASSVFFNAITPSVSTSAAATTSQFGPGALGGPTRIEFSGGYGLQANFGGNGNASSGLYGGVFNLLVSNVNEKSMFAIATSALVSSTGTVMLVSDFANYNYVDFQFIPSVTSTSGFLSVILTSKAGV